MMNQRYRCILLCLLLVGTLSTGVSMAQAQNPPVQERQEDNTAPAAGEENEQEQAEEEKTPAAKRNSADTFVPSEGISEDLSVSFPVDI